MSLDPALCADGCGRPADRERRATGELVCSDCRETLLNLLADEQLHWTRETP